MPNCLLIFLSKNQSCGFIFQLDIEEKLKLWTPKPMLDTNEPIALPMEKFIIESKVKYQC